MGATASSSAETYKYNRTMPTIVTPFLAAFNEEYKILHPDDVPYGYRHEKEITGALKITKIPVVTYLKKLQEKEAAERAGKEAAKLEIELMEKNGTRQGAKVFGKEVVEEGGKCALKKLPVVSFLFGAGFAIYRATSSCYFLIHGDYARALEEAGKAVLETASGVAGCFPGPGTAISFAVDGVIAAWDIGDALLRSDAEKDKTAAEIRLQNELDKINQAIKEKEFTAEDMLKFILTTALNEMPDTYDLVDQGLYLNELTLFIYKDPSTTFQTAFSFDNIVKEMQSIGFTSKQIQWLTIAREVHDRHHHPDTIK